MKRLLFFFMLYTPFAFAQVKGRIVDDGGRPMAYATVSLLSAKDSVSMLSTDSGVFNFGKLMMSNCILSVSSIGYQTWRSVAFSAPKDFGVISMQPDGRALKTVTVQASRPVIQQSAAGTSINVESSLMTKGSNALDVLSRLPGVTVDRQNGDLLLNGRSGVQILVDGKPVRIPVNQLITMLQGMSGDELSKIDLLTAPGAAYDAEGSAGAINISLKKSRKPGVAGSVTVGGGYGYGEKANAALNLEATKNNLTVYGSYSYLHDRSYSGFAATGSELEPLLGGQTNSAYTSVTKPMTNSHNLQFGIDSKHMGGRLNYSRSDVSLPTFNHGIYQVANDSLYYLDAQSEGNNHWRSIAADYYAEKIWNTAKLRFTADYLDYDNQYPTTAQSSFLSNHGYPAGTNDTLFAPTVRTSSDTRIRVGSSQLDFSQNINSKTSLKAGIKGTYTTTDGTSAIESLLNNAWVVQSDGATDSRMKEGIAAGYLSLDAKPDTNLSLSAGLRYEYSATRINNVPTDQVLADRKLSNLFPSVMITKQLNASDALEFSYSRRISRPSYTDLASYVSYNGPTSTNSGNPLLLATTTDITRLWYRNALFSLGASWSKDHNPIVRYQQTTNSDTTQLVVKPENMLYQDNWSLDANLPFHIGSFWEMNYNLSGILRKFSEDFTPVPATKTYLTWMLQGSERFKLPAKWSAEISGYQYGPFYSGSRKYDGYGVLNAGIRKTLSGNTGSIQFSVDDILKTGAMSSHFGALITEALNLQTHVIHQGEAARYRIFRISYTHSFGSGTSKPNTETLQEERKRLGS